MEIGATCEVTWIPSRTPGKVCAQIAEGTIFPSLNRWRGRYPERGDCDLIEIIATPSRAIFYCVRLEKDYRVGEIMKVRWRITQSGNNLVCCIGDTLIWPKFNRVNWGSLLCEGNVVQVLLVERVGFKEFRCVPAPENSFLRYSDMKLGEIFLLEFSLGHQGCIALLSDRSVVIPETSSWMPQVGEIWPVKVCRIKNTIFVEPVDKLVFAQDNSMCGLNSVWPNHKVVKFISSSMALIDGAEIFVNTTAWAEPPLEGEVWAVSVEDGNRLEPFIRVDVNPNCDDRYVLRFQKSRGRIAASNLTKRIICFPCRQKWEQLFGLPIVDEVYAVRVVGSNFVGQKRVQFVEPFVQIPQEFVPDWI